jgi:hypothetical protein
MNIVTAHHLEAWSDALAAREDLPGVVASLIRASCPRLGSYRFPSGDASQTHGFDGVAEVLEGNVFVPEGRSVWEFGVGKKYESKATQDYSKRTEELSAAERAQQTFVFVTPRIWDGGPEEWEQARSANGWLKVRALDAPSLELWLADYPAVALPLARKLGIIPPSGVRTLQDFWDEYRLNFDPTLKEEVLLNGRGEQAKRLCEALGAGLPSLIKLKTDSPTEAAAFVAAAIMKAEPETHRFLLAKTLILETVDAAQTVPITNRFNFILPPAVSRVGPALARTNQVILVLGSEDRAPGPELEKLDRMNVVDFAGGLKSMGIEEGEAFRLAGVCGRSLTVLSRLKASAIAVRPKWHDDPKLVPIVLAGGWDASNEHDRAVVAELCDASYGDVDSEARRLASLSDAPLDLEGCIWTLRSHMDTFTWLGCLVDTGGQQRLHAACVRVFSERDRTLDTPEDSRPAIPTRGNDFQHSEWLRRGLARTLLMISGLHEAAGFTTIGLTPEQYVENVIRSIPRLSEDIGVLASLKSEFPRLTEAAPRPLARALERVLEGDSKVWAPIVFRDKKDDSLWSSFSPHTYVLWALETMAWSPEYLNQAASILMTLAEFDPGGRLDNRPLKSLREIFLAWHPNTYASVDERIAVLRSVCRKRPRVGLELVMALLPRDHDYSSPTAKPHLRDFGQAQSRATTPADVQHAFSRYAEFAVELARTNVSSLTALVDSLPQLDAPTRERAIAAISASARSTDPDAAFQLWSKLHSLVQKHRSFQGAGWALPPDQLTPLEQVCQEIGPQDAVRQIEWLFNDDVPQMGPTKGQDYIGEANRVRSAALGALLREQGVTEVVRLARVAKLPHFVGVALADATADLAVLEEAMHLATAADSGVSMDFAIALSARAHDSRGLDWDRWIRQFVTKLEPGSAASLFFRWADRRNTWDFVASLAPEIEKEYWHRKWAFSPTSHEDLLFAFGKYAEIGRFSAILEMVAYNESSLSTSQCVQVLNGLSSELNKDPRLLRGLAFGIAHMIQALQQRQDVELDTLAALEYQYLPVLEFQAPPVALNRLLGTSPKLFVDLICDVFLPASGERGEISDERRARARLGYRVLQSMTTVPGFASGAEDVQYLRSWVSEVRSLAVEADRAAITDQQIGQILAYAPPDGEDGGWPLKSIRDLIEELASEEVERGIAVCRFNQRGAFSKALYDGGGQERGLANQYRKWAEISRDWPRTSALLRRIAEDWDAHARRADSEAQLDQLRHTL